MQVQQAEQHHEEHREGTVGALPDPRSRVAVRRRGDGSLVPVAVRPVSRVGDERGMVSAEWAVAIIAAISLAGVVIMIVGSGPVKEALLKFILLVIKQFSAVAGIR